MSMEVERSTSDGATVTETLEQATALARSAFCGYHQDFINSLALLVAQPLLTDVDDDAEQKDGMDKEVDVQQQQQQMQDDAFERLLWCATPESVCRLSPEQIEQLEELSGKRVDREYFEKQSHSTLGAFATKMLPKWSDEIGSQTMVLTYAHPQWSGCPAAYSRQRVSVSSRASALVLVTALQY